MSNTSTTMNTSNLFSPPIGIDRAQQPQDFSTSNSTNNSTQASSGHFNVNALRSSMMMQNNTNPMQGLSSSSSASSSAATNSTANITGNSSGARLLNAHGINTTSLFQKAKTLQSRMYHHHHHHHQTTSSSPPSSNNNNIINESNNNIINNIPRHYTIQQSIDYIRQSTIHTILSNQKVSSKQDVAKKTERRIQKDWNKTKKEVMDFSVILDDTGRRIMIVKNDGDNDGSSVSGGENGSNISMDGLKHTNTLALMDPTSTIQSSTTTTTTTTTRNNNRSSSMTMNSFSISSNPNELQEFYNFANYHHYQIYNTPDYQSYLSEPQLQRMQQEPQQSNAYNSHIAQLIMDKVKHVGYELSMSQNGLSGSTNNNDGSSSNSSGMFRPYFNGCKLISTLSTTNFATNTPTTPTTGGGGMLGMMMHPSPLSSISTTTTTSNKPLANVKERTISSLLFLSQQFREYIITKVKNMSSTNNNNNNNNSLSGFTNYITKYVQYEIGSDLYHSGKNRDVLFQCMYYCLRCGDVHGALELYVSSQVSLGSGTTTGGNGSGSGTGTGANGNVMKDILEFLVRFIDQNIAAGGGVASGSSATNTTTISNEEKSIGLFQGLNHLPSNHIADMKDLYQHVLLNKQTQQQQHILGGNANATTTQEVGDYEIALIGMMGFCCGDDNNDTNHTNVATTTIEDYVFMKLWNV